MEIRPWHPGDEALAVAAEPYLSAASLSHRFLAGTGGRLPLGYVRHLAGGPRPAWDAQVAVGSGHLIGWAEFGRLPGVIAQADLAVLVADAWHRQGVATALIRALLPRAAAAGVRNVRADVLPGNRAAHGLLAALFRKGLRAEYDEGVIRYHARLAELPIVTGHAYAYAWSSAPITRAAPAVVSRCRAWSGRWDAVAGAAAE
jgi:GNAT superfamily N-acetyltransferase